MEPRQLADPSVFCTVFRFSGRFFAVIHRFCIKILKMPSYEDIAHPLDE